MTIPAWYRGEPDRVEIPDVVRHEHAVGFEAVRQHVLEIVRALEQRVEDVFRLDPVVTEFPDDIRIQVLVDEKSPLRSVVVRLLATRHPLFVRVDTRRTVLCDTFAQFCTRLFARGAMALHFL
jgi:hypothetical protein